MTKNVLVIVPAVEEWKRFEAFFPSGKEWWCVPSTDADQIRDRAEGAEVVIIPRMDEDSMPLEFLRAYAGPVLGGAVMRSLVEVRSELDFTPRFTLYGINLWPGFDRKAVREMSRDEGAPVPDFVKAWGWKVEWVADRVGMVTPRLLAMIINEAFYTVQEGTADPAAIDVAMRLGTNYPGGPFEWVELFGVGRVYRLLARLQETTGDPRYRPAPLLRDKALAARRSAP